jgi:hypothetical protein
MKKCQKYRALPSHHMNPAGSCGGCVYFSSRNCKTHAAAPLSDDISFAINS